MALYPGGDDAAFDAAIERLPAPPRPVPLSLRWHLRAGGMVSLVGWIFSAVSLILVVALLDLGALLNEVRLDEDAALASGTAVGWLETNVIINDVDVVENRVRFPCATGHCDCVSYADGLGLEAGASVEVLYRPDAPDICRVVGMRTSKAGLVGLLIVSIFAAIGALILLVPALLAGPKLRLLRVGRYTKGVVFHREATGMYVNNAQVWRLTLRFTDHTGTEHRAVFKTSLVEDVTDDREEGVLYDPARPTRFTMVDLLPDAVRLSPDGAWRPVDGRRKRMGLIGPAVFAAAGLLMWMVS